MFLLKIPTTPLKSLAVPSEDGESSSASSKAGEKSGLGKTIGGGLQSTANAVSSVADGVSTG